MKIIGFCVIAGLWLGISTVSLADTPIQFSTINLNAPADENVRGVRFPFLYGKTGSVHGIDLHLIALAETDEFVGVQLPLLLFGANHTNSSMKGVAFGLWNWNKGQTTGLNMGAVNITTRVRGANIALVNLNRESTTFDLGVFNKTERLEGLQLGLINCAKNGFLPCFILFNFGK
ncbi:VC2662 family protein [Pseudomaricurvus sp. HS19]|uniref:VC2662 family protein n=1 Tax=Pseudomaricurvus sp. HS19 TaxID=2692626 RepID=UPI001371230D|nr:phaC PHA synthase [Pseudomaricurvus sp. HS19]MYM63110.1 phaC PHA synthase [Pseudomaricurvus sp. HS19]